MAEAVGVVAAAVGILDVATKGSHSLGRICSSWRHAPDELLALRNEIEDLRMVLDQITASGVAAGDSSAPQASNALVPLDALLKKAEGIVKDFDTLVDKIASIKKYKARFNCMWRRILGPLFSPCCVLATLSTAVCMRPLAPSERCGRPPHDATAVQLLTRGASGVRKEGKVDKLKERIRGVRENIHDVLIAHNV